MTQFPVWYVCLCMSAGTDVGPPAYPRNYMSNLHQIFVRVTYGRGSVLSGGVVIRHVLPVSRMTSCLQIFEWWPGTDDAKKRVLKVTCKVAAHARIYNLTCFNKTCFEIFHDKLPIV